MSPVRPCIWFATMRSTCIENSSFSHNWASRNLSKWGRGESRERNGQREKGKREKSVSTRVEETNGRGRDGQAGKTNETGEDDKK